MGTIQLAKCDCGFEKEMLIGAGRRDFETRNLFPYYCKECNSIFSGNTYDKVVICKNCESSDVLSYDNPKLVKDLDEETAKNEPYFIHKNSLCPQCKGFSLMFKVVGRWS